MKENLKLFCILFVMQAIGYLLIVINWRAVSQAHIPMTLVSDGIYASLQYFIFKKIAADKDSKLFGFLGYVLGSELGSYLGIIFSQHLLGK